MKTAVFYEHILEGAKQSGKSVAELMEKCASWNIRGIEIGDALLRENKEEIKELLEKNHMQVSCSNAFYDFGHNPDAAQGKKTDRPRRRVRRVQGADYSGRAVGKRIGCTQRTFCVERADLFLHV